jgi:anti-sigma regulatory factor (Ser/Thr protein kinase)
MRQHFEGLWPARPESVPDARRAATAWASDVGAATEQLGDIALAVSEACTNAVLHAYVGATPGSFRVCVERTGEAIRVLVTDWGHGLRPRPDSPGLGLGLPVIASLTTSMEVHTGDEEAGTTLVMAFAA